MSKAFRSAVRSNIARQYADPFYGRPEREKIETTMETPPRSAKMSFHADAKGLTVRIGDATIRQSWTRAA